MIEVYCVYVCISIWSSIPECVELGVCYRRKWD